MRYNFPLMVTICLFLCALASIIWEMWFIDYSYMSANIYRSSYYQSKNEYFNTIKSCNNVLVSRDSELFSSPENVMAVA